MASAEKFPRGGGNGIKGQKIAKSTENSTIKGVLNPNFRPFSFELNKKWIF